jgi:diguanylate cyclase (GGDEF)-like protein
VAERIRADIATLPVHTQKGTLRITISIGASALASHEGLSAIIARADEALYAAKRTGRNRVVVDALKEENENTSSLLEQKRA